MINLSEVEGRCNEATEGPWEAAPVMMARSDDTCSWSESVWRIINGPPQVIQEEMSSKRAFTHIPDADFIAHARTDLPEALRLLREAREIIDEYCKSVVTEDGEWPLDELSMKSSEWLRKVQP
jgi:hypothetical protein